MKKTIFTGIFLIVMLTQVFAAAGTMTFIYVFAGEDYATVTNYGDPAVKLTCDSANISEKKDTINTILNKLKGTGYKILFINSNVLRGDGTVYVQIVVEK